MANLALCARMAHQSDSLATPLHSGTPSAFLVANEVGWHSFGYFSFATERKVTRQWGETHNLTEVYKSQIKTNNKKNKKSWNLLIPLTVR